MGGFNSKVANDRNQSKNPQQARPINGGRSVKGNVGSVKDSHRFSLKLDAGDTGVSIKTLTFRHVMKDPLGREYFMIFLKLEHAEENLIFFEVRFLATIFMPTHSNHCANDAHQFFFRR